LARWFGLGVGLAAPLVVAGCQKAGTPDAPLGPEPHVVQAPAANAGTSTSSGGAVSAPANDVVELELPSGPMRVTLADAEAIRAALVARLQKSDLADRDALIKMTEHAPVAIDSGFLRIGAWLLQAQDDALTLTYRGPLGPAMAQIYRAEIAKEGGSWVAKDVVAGQVRVRR
jgi:hypothetical protein